MVAAVPGGELLAGRDEVETGACRQLGPELLGPELLDQVAHAGQAPALAVAELAEELGDGPGDLDRLVGSHEDVDVRGHALAVGETATGQDVEPERPVRSPCRPQPDVVDLRLGTVLAASGHAHLELAGQVGVLAVAGEEVRDRPGHGQGVEDLVGVHARHRTRQARCGPSRRTPGPW